MGSNPGTGDPSSATTDVSISVKVNAWPPESSTGAPTEASPAVESGMDASLSTLPPLDALAAPELLLDPELGEASSSAFDVASEPPPEPDALPEGFVPADPDE
jgi:hypothetical protein